MITHISNIKAEVAEKCCYSPWILGDFHCLGASNELTKGLMGNHQRQYVECSTMFWTRRDLRGQQEIGPWLLFPITMAGLARICTQHSKRWPPIGHKGSDNEGVLGHTPQYELVVNVANLGGVANLPAWAMVEILATVDAAGVHGLQVGPLKGSLWTPPGINQPVRPIWPAPNPTGP